LEDEETTRVIKTLSEHAAFTTPSYNDLMPVTDKLDMPDLSNETHEAGQANGDNIADIGDLSGDSQAQVPRSKRTRQPPEQFKPVPDLKKRKKGLRLRLGKIGLLGRKKKSAAPASSQQSITAAKLKANNSSYQSADL